MAFSMYSTTGKVVKGSKCQCPAVDGLQLAVPKVRSRFYAPGDEQRWASYTPKWL